MANQFCSALFQSNNKVPKSPQKKREIPSHKPNISVRFVMSDLHGSGSHFLLWSCVLKIERGMRTRMRIRVRSDTFVQFSRMFTISEWNDMMKNNTIPTHVTSIPVSNDLRSLKSSWRFCFSSSVNVSAISFDHGSLNQLNT
jgi:hypothetical protein